ncbi:hypothetical protein H6G76_21600 [Nostoc sp. FACHB-152]|uniref:hypothetical protein n=1 Tax=unclassified Nostoc TaxID=2593658 RepID=UPI001688551E|nr:MULTISPECIES: hypothetical protein [unclassified Nostoc]MBD2449714.1 hypothetical protein [Nostoc sp. FACHB-152]MBD2469066.1 hypothetical protein [Nostoc sp. FACHB-145]
MSQAILQQILNQLDLLEPEELQELNQAIKEHFRNQEQAQRTRFHTELLNSGLVKQIKQASSKGQTERRFIQVQGKPVSETIIEERL